MSPDTDQATALADLVGALPPRLRDRFDALDFVERQLPESDELRRFYAAWRQDLRRRVEAGEELPADADLPAWTAGEAPAQKSYRYLAYLVRHLHRHGEDGRRPLAWVHEQMNAVRQQLAGLRRKLQAEGLAVPDGATPAQPTADVPVPAIPVPSQHRTPEPPAPRRSVLEILTDPHSIQWFLAAGGGLFVAGLVLLLWSLKVFENPAVVAGFLGVGSLGLIAAGWAVLSLTRFQLAGRATMLLGCLVLPLNIWYYAASGLMTENFWLPATACCAVYAFAAWRLRDPLFVPILVGGVALTGLLILRDADRFFEVATPAAFLVVLALVCVHAERAFAEGDGPFSRRRFGLAFFYSGHAVLLAGLGLLLGGQIQGVVVRHWWHGPAEYVPLVLTEPPLKALALALVLVGAYLYLYSDLLVRHRRVYSYLAAFCLLWAEVVALDLAGLGLTLETIVFALAGTGLAVHVLEYLWKDRPEGTRSLSVFALLLNLSAVVLAVALHVRVLNPGTFPNEGLTTWWPVAALALVAVSSRFGAYLAAGKSRGREWTYFFATAAATVLAVAEALVLLEVEPRSWHAIVLLLVPIAYVVAARLYRGHSAETPLVWCGHLATAAILACSVPLLYPSASVLDGAAICGLATAFYALNALWRQRAFNVYLATLFGVATLWFGLRHFGFEYVETYTVAVAVAGLAVLLAYRLALIDSWQPRATTAVFQSGNLLASLALVAGFFQVVGKLANPFLRPTLEWFHVGYLAALVGVALLAAVLVLHAGWRRWYVVAAIGTALLGLVVAYQKIDLPPWRVAELAAVGLGVLLLAVSLVGWARERDDQPSDHADFGLLLGSLLVVVPLAIGVGVYRFAPLNAAGQVELSGFDEVLFALGGLALFGVGFMLRLKVPTLLGGLAVVGNLVMLVVLAHRFMDSLWVVASCITAGGLLLFGTGLVLSVYRDWLLALPERIRTGQGVWKVLTWR